MLVHSHCCNQNWILSNFKLRQINSIFSRHRFVWFLLFFFLLLWCLFVCVYLIGRYSVFAYFVSDFVRRFPLDTVGNGNNNNRKIILKNNFITLSRTRHTKFVTFIIFFCLLLSLLLRRRCFIARFSQFYWISCVCSPVIFQTTLFGRLFFCDRCVIRRVKELDIFKAQKKRFIF